MSGSAWSNQVQDLVITAGVTGGVFAYNPSLTLGDLIASLTGASEGPLGETAVPGVTAYGKIAGAVYAVNLNVEANGFIGMGVEEIARPPFALPGFGAIGSASSASAQVNSGQQTSGDVASFLEADSQTTSGITNGLVKVGAGEFLVNLGFSVNVNTDIATFFGTEMVLNPGSYTVIAGGGSGTLLIDCGTLDMDGAFSATTQPVTLTGGTAANPSTLSTDTWHLMSLLNSWANAAAPNVAAAYRLLASPPNSVEIIGAVSATAATSDTFFTLPSGYIPTAQQQIPCGATGGVGADQVTFVQCDTSGDLSIARGTIGANDTYVFHGTLSLDAAQA